MADTAGGAEPPAVSRPGARAGRQRRGSPAPEMAREQLIGTRAICDDRQDGGPPIPRGPCGASCSTDVDVHLLVHGAAELHPHDDHPDVADVDDEDEEVGEERLLEGRAVAVGGLRPGRLPPPARTRLSMKGKCGRGGEAPWASPAPRSRPRRCSQPAGSEGAASRTAGGTPRGRPAIATPTAAG